MSILVITGKTRKLSYRKDNRAMRRIYECPKHFWESLSKPTATLCEIFNGLLFRSILWMCVENVKFVGWPVLKTIRAIQKIGQFLDTPTLPFLPNFSWACVRMDRMNLPAKFAVHSFTLREIIAIEVLGGNPNLGEEEAVWRSEMVPFERALMSS